MSRLMVGLVLATLAGCASPGSGGPATGRWLTQSGRLEVEIAPCGDALCGTVVRVLSSGAMAPGGSPDSGTPERPVLGLKVLEGLLPSGEGRWSGRIYNRENGKTYDCILTVAGPDEIKLRPYIFVPLFGQTQSWRRVAAN